MFREIPLNRSRSIAPLAWDWDRGVKCEMCAAASIQLGAKMYHLIQIKLILTLNQNSPRAME